MRRKPPGKLLPSAHAVDREFRVISALHPTGFPVPRPYGLCTDDGVIGTMFYVMDMVEGPHPVGPVAARLRAVRAPRDPHGRAEDAGRPAQHRLSRGRSRGFRARGQLHAAPDRALDQAVQGVRDGPPRQDGASDRVAAAHRPGRRPDDHRPRGLPPRQHGAARHRAACDRRAGLGAFDPWQPRWRISLMC